MSTANRTACAVSTTSPPPEWSSSWREPRGMYCVMTISCGGALQQPKTGRILGCEKIRNFGNSSLKSRETRALHSRIARIFATISLFCQRPRHDSPDGEIASFRWSVRSWILIPLKRESVASFVRVFADQLASLNEILRNSWPVSTANLCRLKMCKNMSKMLKKKRKKKITLTLARELVSLYPTVCLHLCSQETREHRDLSILWRFQCNPRNRRNVGGNFHVHLTHSHQIDDE